MPGNESLTAFKKRWEIQKAKDTKLMENEKYDITGYERQFEMMKKNWEEIGRTSSILFGIGDQPAKYCEAFGRLLQAEMKKNNGQLTEEMVKNISVRAGEFGLKIGNEFHLVGWKYSHLLQQFDDYKISTYDIKRITWSDRAHGVYDKYRERIEKSEGQERQNVMADMLTDVFVGNNAKLEDFYNKFTNPDSFKDYNVKGICPGFKAVKDLTWCDFAFACTKAVDQIREAQTRKVINNNLNTGIPR